MSHWVQLGRLCPSETSSQGSVVEVLCYVQRLQRGLPGARSHWKGRICGFEELFGFYTSISQYLLKPNEQSAGVLALCQSTVDKLYQLLSGG